MTDDKALEIAHIIKQFGRCMLADDHNDYTTQTSVFSDMFDAFASKYTEESVVTVAGHITRAISTTAGPGHLDETIFAQVLPDLLDVLDHATPALRQVS